MKQIPFLILVGILLIFASGCSSVHVSGSGEIGGVHGGGDVSIPLPTGK